MANIKRNIKKASLRGSSFISNIRYGLTNNFTRMFNNVDSIRDSQLSDPPVVKYLEATGGVITIDGDYVVHTFSSSDTLEITQLATDPANNECEVLLIAGGGGGGVAGAGAGGFKTFTQTAVVGSHLAIVGSGGAGQIPGGSPNKGNDSSVFGVTSTGGGGGATVNGAGWNGNLRSGGQGGSGGGGAQIAGASGAPGIVGEGNAGGTCNWALFNPAGGGGKGSSAPNVNSGPNSGNGGNGLASSISGVSITYCGGGGGGNDGTGSPGLGGSGGGGNGTITTGSNGTANRGSGGGGGFIRGGSGGSGIIYVKYYKPI